MAEQIVDILTAFIFSDDADAMITGSMKETIVRCKDCSHLRQGEGDGSIVPYFCNHPRRTIGSLEVEPRGFCYWGEMKDG